MNYWLFKSEPDAFSIDDLRNMPVKRDHWDGIRNYQARNMMRDDMKKVIWPFSIILCSPISANRTTIALNWEENLTQNLTFPLRSLFSDSLLGGCPRIEDLLRMRSFGQNITSISSNRTTILLNRREILTQNLTFSLRSLFSDSLLESLKLNKKLSGMILLKKVAAFRLCQSVPTNGNGFKPCLLAEEHHGTACAVLSSN